MSSIMEIHNHLGRREHIREPGCYTVERPTSLCPSFPEHRVLNGGGVSITTRSPGVAQQERSIDVVERI
jgi:hypothetical protein